MTTSMTTPSTARASPPMTGMRTPPRLHRGPRTTRPPLRGPPAARTGQVTGPPTPGPSGSLNAVAGAMAAQSQASFDRTAAPTDSTSMRVVLRLLAVSVEPFAPRHSGRKEARTGTNTPPITGQAGPACRSPDRPPTSPSVRLPVGLHMGLQPKRPIAGSPTRSAFPPPPLARACDRGIPDYREDPRASLCHVRAEQSYVHSWMPGAVAI